MSILHELQWPECINDNMTWQMGLSVQSLHDDVIKRKHYPRYWPFVWGHLWIPLTKTSDAELWCFVLFLICAWTNSWANNRDTGDLRCHRGHYDVTVMWYLIPVACSQCVDDALFLPHTWVRYPGFSGHEVQCLIGTTVVPGFSGDLIGCTMRANGVHMRIYFLPDKNRFCVK